MYMTLMAIAGEEATIDGLIKFKNTLKEGQKIRSSKWQGLIEKLIV